MKKISFIIIALWLTTALSAQSFSFDFTPGKKCKDGYVKVTNTDVYSAEKGYGFDFQTFPDVKKATPFFFSVQVPDGNYKVTVVLGSKKQKGETTVRAESRRLFLEHIATRKGELQTYSFVVNKRNTIISDTEKVRIKAREQGKLNWDDKLTLEFNGTQPCLSEVLIEKVDNVPTIFLCGNSTVVDQDNEPWASWGQMITRFFNDQICFANYAESGERADTFIAAGRLKKALSQMKKGDYIFMEFGHNDQKVKGPGKGAFYSFMTNLKVFIDEARARGAYPVLVTPTQRRSFGPDGKNQNTHLDYPEAVRFLAARENVPLIELNEMTGTLYEALGVEGSKKAFVHYPAGSYPGQDKPLADNTHFNPYGAYQIAKCIIMGMKQSLPVLIPYLREDVVYDPAQPDTEFRWNDSPFTEVLKPDGN
ncbi:MAG: rhamnogalacturonan acetylesterase [Mediterranea massiliensis]|nr:rhamnogalacturonan acetylesterase [Mediterranea massiliensis]